MNERLIRFTASGLTFLLAIIFAIWYTGGKLLSFADENKIKILEIILVILASPSIGFILSSIITSGLRLLFPERIEYLRPSSKDGIDIQAYLKKIYDSKNGESGVSYNGENNVYSISNFHSLYMSHQLLLRNNASNEVIKFTERRMDFYWTHINTIFSICLGLAIGIILNMPLNGQIDFGKMLWIIPILVYVVLGIWIARRNLHHSNEFEKRFILSIQ